MTVVRRTDLSPLHTFDTGVGSDVSPSLTQRAAPEQCVAYRITRYAANLLSRPEVGGCGRGDAIGRSDRTVRDVWKDVILRG